MARKPPKKQTHIRVRIDNDLLTRLEKERFANSRTRDGEIIHRLEESFRRQDVGEIIKEAARTAAAEAIRNTQAFLMSARPPQPDPFTQQAVDEYRESELERRIMEKILVRLAAQK
jgi:hypothetical protein